MRLPERFNEGTLLFMADGCVLNLSGILTRDAPVEQERTRLSTDTNCTRGVLGHCIIIGCGGIGWHVAQTIALAEMASALTLVDGDTLEAGNLNRIPVTHALLGQPKVLALAAEIARVRPALPVVPVHGWLPPMGVRKALVGLVNTVYSRHIIIDCTDNPTLQNDISEAASGMRRDYGTQHVRISYDGLAHITIKHNRIARALDEQAGRYTNTPSWALPAQFAAILGVYSLLRECYPDVYRAVEPRAAIQDEYGFALCPKKRR